MPQPAKKRRTKKRKLDEVIITGLRDADVILDRINKVLARRVLKLYSSDPVNIQAIVDAAREVLEEFAPRLAKVLSDVRIAGWVLGIDEIVKSLPEVAADELEGLQIGKVETRGNPTKHGLPIIDKAAAELRARQVVTKDEFNELSDELKADSFTVAGDWMLDALFDVRDKVVDAVDKGTTLDEFREQLDEDGLTSFLYPAHSENVFRTNVMSSYAKAKMDIGRNPIVSATLPFMAYDAIGDSRVRPEHLALMKLGLSGTNIYWADDSEFWANFFPPWGFQCRCTATRLTVRQAAQRGVQLAKDWLETGIRPPMVSSLPGIPFRRDPTFVGPGVRR